MKNKAVIFLEYSLVFRRNLLWQEGDETRFYCLRLHELGHRTIIKEKNVGRLMSSIRKTWFHVVLRGNSVGFILVLGKGQINMEKNSRESITKPMNRSQTCLLRFQSLLKWWLIHDRTGKSKPYECSLVWEEVCKCHCRNRLFRLFPQHR